MLIRTENLRKTYHRGQERVEALRGVNLTVEEGEFLTVMGPSGCGKSTLLHLIGGIDRPTAGHIYVDGVDLSTLNEEGLTRFRREKVGFVFQFYNLLPPSPPWRTWSSPSSPWATREPPDGRWRRPCWTWWVWATG